MDKEFIQARYADTVEEELTSNLNDRCRVIASMIGASGELLDIGCWDGSVARKYTEQFLKNGTSSIDGVDLVRHPRALDFYRSVFEADISRTALPIPADQYDYVVLSEVIEHVFDTDFVLSEIHRVLKPSGILIITTPNLASIINRLFLLFGLQPLYTEVSSKKSTYGNPFRRDGKPAGHIRDITFRALVDLVGANGFSVERKVSVPGVAKQPFALIERVAGMLLPGLGGNSILQCRKK
ncbi:MAG: class I SAM-dependent methyltransferase [Chitinispirillaceae bacterium]|nr:class I SAM-dependent methyltransferase [Chitinispirillaceae bacterium]